MSLRMNNLTLYVFLIALVSGSTACETPINDSGLEAQVRAERSREGAEEAQTSEASTSEDDAGVSSAPRSDLDAESPSSSGDSTSDSEERGVMPDSLDEPCEASEACINYWVSFSECGEIAAGPEGFIDPSVYTDNCKATCALAAQLDYVSYYACLEAGIPSDCENEVLSLPECEI